VSHNIGNSVAEKRKLAVGSGIRNNEKNQRSAAGLYIAPGFAHYQSQAAGNGLI